MEVKRNRGRQPGPLPIPVPSPAAQAVLNQAKAKGWTTRATVVELRKVDPGLRAATMAHWLGVSRMNVTKLLKLEGLPTRVDNSGWGGDRTAKAKTNRAQAKRQQTLRAKKRKGR